MKWGTVVWILVQVASAAAVIWLVYEDGFQRGKASELKTCNEVSIPAARTEERKSCQSSTAITDEGRNVTDQNKAAGCADNADLRVRLCESRLRNARATSVATCGRLDAPAPGRSEPDLLPAPERSPRAVDDAAMGGIGSDADAVRAEALGWRAWWAKCVAVGRCNK